MIHGNLFKVQECCCWFGKLGNGIRIIFTNLPESWTRSTDQKATIIDFAEAGYINHFYPNWYYNDRKARRNCLS